MVIICVDWIIIIPFRFPATTPRIWVRTRMAGIKVCARRASRGPNFLTDHPVMKRLKVPKMAVSQLGHSRPKPSGERWRTAERRAHAEDTELRRRAGCDFVQAASVPGPLIRRVVVIVLIASHDAKDIKEAGGDTVNHSI